MQMGNSAPVTFRKSLRDEWLLARWGTRGLTGRGSSRACLLGLPACFVLTFGLLDTRLRIGGVGIDRRQAASTLGRDQVAEADRGILTFFCIGLVDQLLGTTGETAATHRRTAKRACPADHLVGHDLVVP